MNTYIILIRLSINIVSKAMDSLNYFFYSSMYGYLSAPSHTIIQ